MEYWKNLDLADIRYFCEERNDWFVEEWRDIPKWKGLYQVSDLGRLKSFRLKEVKVLRQSFTNKGYLSFGFSVNGKIKVHTTHVVVAMAFLSHEPCRYKRIVDHKVENNRTDNRLINLQIVTPRKNNSKAIDKSKTTSKFTGVSIDNSIETENIWRAAISVDRKTIYLGCYPSEELASGAYQKALIDLERGLKITPYINPKKTSKYLGVNWDKGRNKWLVRFRSKNIGRFDDEYSAHLKYLEASEKYNLEKQSKDEK